MADYLRSIDIPAYIEILDWKGLDVQEVFARSRMLVTDYTSANFDIALMRRPVAYYQFDRDTFFSSGHMFRRGYFNYDRDGFGPVARTQDELLAALEELAARDFAPDAETARRMDATFGERRGDACYQVYKAISRLTRPVRVHSVDGTSVLEPSVQPVEDEPAQWVGFDGAHGDGLRIEDPPSQGLVTRDETLARDTSINGDLVAVAVDAGTPEVGPG